MDSVPPKIRVLSLALIRRPSDGRWLAVYGDDTRKQQPFYRPPGGGVEFGETSRDAVIREMREEFDAPVEPLRLLGTTENLFAYMGKPGHEIVFLWECRFVDFVDRNFYTQEEFVISDDGGSRAPAHWIDPDDLAKRAIALYPDGLGEILRSAGTFRPGA